jgi:WD40 repeat protein
MIAPPKPSPAAPPAIDLPCDPEALIEEARRHTRRRRRRNGITAALALGVGALAMAVHGRGASNSHVSAPNPPAAITVAARSVLMHNGPLTLTRQVNGRGGIYTVGRHGLGRLVTRCEGCMEVEYIAWAPDGSRMALGVNSYAAVTTRDGIHVIDPSTGRDRIVTGESWADPSWSPDGKWIAYEGGRPGTISLIRADGSQRATVDTGLAADLRSPTWSPDGRQIAFQTTARSGCGKPELNWVRGCAVYAVGLDGSAPRLLARHAASPVWSPVGTVIAYRSRCGVRLMSPTGAETTPVVGAPCLHVADPNQFVFSPDGRKIAISSAAHGRRGGVYVVNVDGSHLVHVTRARGRSDFGMGNLAWQPLA